jgi:hypothetical protein
MRAEAGEHGVGSGDGRLQRCLIRGGQIGGDDLHLAGQLAWVADHCGDVVPGGEGLLKKSGADAAGGGDDRELHGFSVLGVVA